LDYASIRNLPLMFFEEADRHPDRPFLWRKQDGTWRSQSWSEVASDVTRLSLALRAKGIVAGDRVALISENRPEWLIADLAVMAAGAITVPAYTTNTVDDHRYILDNTAAAHAPSVEFLVAIEPPPPGSERELRTFLWAEMLSLGAAEPDDVRAVAGLRQRTDLACLIYTSGTGGAPKGVMLSHGAIICNAMGAADVLAELGLGREVFLSFLPLSHAYEHTGGQFFPISIGAEIYYAEGADALAQNFLEAKATIITAVPRLYEVLHGRVTKGIERASRLKRAMFERTLELGRRRYEQPGSLGLGERILDAILERLVRRKVRQRFGGRLKAFVSGGAPLNYEVGVFFTALGVRLLQGYGQTEAAPVISCNRPSKIKLRTVGPPLKGVEAKLGPDGEVLVRGELLMQGYWGDPEATARTIRDGWLHTADIGRIDEDGYIEITDRKRDIIVVSGGDNVSPQKIEGFLTLQPEIAQAMVVGDKRPYLAALVVPDKDWAADWAEKQGKPADLAGLVGEDAFRQAIGQAIDRVNQRLSNIERVRQFTMTQTPFTQDNAMLTPTLKIRRHEIRKVHGAKLDQLYEGRG
jgi:long-chain acyl-CoA synthetase